MKNKNIFQGGFCALFFLAFLTDAFGQNPILRSTTTGTPTVIGQITPSVLTQKDVFVGIGTTDPTQRLTLAGSIHTWGVIGGGVTTEYRPPILRFFYNVITPSPTWDLSGGNTFDLKYVNSDLTVLSVTKTGQVGIGTTTPAEKLEVSGGNVKVNGGNVSIVNGTFTVNNGSNQFKVYSNGNVRAREVLIDLVTIPDYVFEDKYPLMPIEELNEYIAKHKHLPGIASEKEYQQEGAIKLGELNIQLLEKVEELTLYVIQLKQEINELKKPNPELKK